MGKRGGNKGKKQKQQQQQQKGLDEQAKAKAAAEEALRPSIYQQHVEGKELDLAMSQLDDVSTADLAKANVAVVDLSHNNLSTLPSDFGTLTMIVRLDLSKNRLTALPDSFGNLHRLTRLDLVSNRLT